jgi:hypothetical protein
MGGFGLIGAIETRIWGIRSLRLPSGDPSSIPNLKQNPTKTADNNVASLRKLKPRFPLVMVNLQLGQHY